MRNRLLDSRLPYLRGGEGRDLTWLALGPCRFRTSRLMASFFPRGTRDSACRQPHLFKGGVLSLEDRQPCPRLICIKQKGSQVSTKHKNS